MKFEIYQDKKKDYRWRARARNGRIVADGSEGYASRSNVYRALNSFIQKVEFLEYTIE